MINKESFKISPIGYIRSPYLEKFAVPRQPGLAPAARSFIEFYPPYCDEAAFEGLDGFSHIYLFFIFDKVDYDHFRPKVRPPRLGGNTAVGVFATRSPFRPNSIGLSVVKLERVIREKGRVTLEVMGADLVDMTPIVDIKPYIPFVDSVPDAVGGFAKDKPAMLEVSFAPGMREYLEETLGPERSEAVCQALSQDPRPAYKDDEEDERVYSAKLYNLEIKFTVNSAVCLVVSVQKISGEIPC